MSTASNARFWDWASGKYARGAIGRAPYAGVVRVSELRRQISAAGFDIPATENHATKGNDDHPYAVARKK